MSALINNNYLDVSNTWVFVSHSNKDYDKVIVVRNRLEALHYKPLLFYLKSLENDDEIFNLIKREIDARERFLLCRSSNTDNSKWVQKEIEYIKSLHRPFDEVNLEASESEIEKSIELFDNNSTIIIWSTDEKYAREAASKFTEKAFKVILLPRAFFEDCNFKYEEFINFKEEFIKRIKGYGYFAFIISDKLSDKEKDIINRIAPSFHHCGGRKVEKVRFYLVEKDGLTSNSDFFYELYNGEGMHARFVYNKSLEETAKKIVDDILHNDPALLSCV